MYRTRGGTLITWKIKNEVREEKKGEEGRTLSGCLGWVEEKRMSVAFWFKLTELIRARAFK